MRPKVARRSCSASIDGLLVAFGLYVLPRDTGEAAVRSLGVAWEACWYGDYVSVSACWRLACWMYLPTVLGATPYFLATSM